MKMLHTEGKQIVDTEGREVRLRGTCIGAWMNLENFMNGVPGTETLLREQAKERLGEEKGTYLFDRMLEHFFTESDVVFLKGLNANVLRIPFHYRHFEEEDKPYVYKEEGFKLLEKAIGWCEKHGIYAILDLHAAPGYQSSDWHCDNASRRSLFWDTLDFQNRFVALWEEMARRYKGRAAVAGYNLLNEPMTNAKFGRLPLDYKPDWDKMNALYKRTVEAIRRIDPDHIVFLEGDFFSIRFAGLDAPFAPNLVYSSHNYSEGLNDPNYGQPGAAWNKDKVRQEFLDREGTKFSDQYNVPLWIGEFGRHSRADEYPQIVADQIEAFEQFGAHWTTWSYKDVGAMGMVRLKGDSPYIELTKDIMTYLYRTGHYDKHPVRTELEKRVADLADFVADSLPLDLRSAFDSNHWVLGTAIDDIYYASLLQPLFLDKFADLSWEEIDAVMRSFRFENCDIHSGAEIVRHYCSAYADV